MLLIAGDNAGSRWYTEKLEKLIGGPSKKVSKTKAIHMALYNKSDFVRPAVKEMSASMKTKL